jgi:hypothetical protein
MKRHEPARPSRKNYAKVPPPRQAVEKIAGPAGDLHLAASTYIKSRPSSTASTMQPQQHRRPSTGARVMALFGDSITTDHISPAGSIKESSPAGQWLLQHGVQPADFNSYGARRGNHDVMVRGTFANVRIKNLMLPPRPTARARKAAHAVPARGPLRGEKLFIYDAAMKYMAARHAAGGVRRRGIRHRLQPRLGRQGHAAAGHQGRGGAQLRAHPPLQPGRHGRAAAAVHGPDGAPQRHASTSTSAWRLSNMRAVPSSGSMKRSALASSCNGLPKSSGVRIDIAG